MKRIKRRLFDFLIISTLTLSFLSCFSSVHSDEELPDNDTEVTIEKVLFQGYLGLDGNLSPDFIARSAAPAPLSITADSTDLEYYVTATSEKHGTVNASVNASDRTFEIGLQLGNWIIEAGVRTKGENSQKILNDSFEVELKTETPTFTHSFYMRPVVEGRGNISLEMNVDSDIVQMRVAIQKQPQGAETSFESSYPAANGKITFVKENLVTGTYNLTFSFYKNDGSADTPVYVPVFSTTQTVNVLTGLTTTKWTAGSSELINSNGKFEITDSLKTAWISQRKEYYVNGISGDDTNSGGPKDPLKTISHAVSVINDISYDEAQVLKIHVASGSQETLASTIQINAGKKIIIDVQGTSTSETGLFRKESSNDGEIAAFSGSMIKILPTAELTLNGITIDGKNIAGSNNIGIENNGKLTINSGVIKGNAAKGLSVIADSTTNIGSGNIQITNNGANNLYLADGSHITITGRLSENTRIGISTENRPTRTSPIQITNDYGTNNSVSGVAAFPGLYFTGDAFGIDLDTSTNEVNLVPNIATIYDSLKDLDMTFVISDDSFTPGTASTFEITPKYWVTNSSGTKTVLTGNAETTALAETTWEVYLYLGSARVEGCSFDSTTRTFTIPDTLTYSDNYDLHIFATYKGMTFNYTVPIDGHI